MAESNLADVHGGSLEDGTSLFSHIEQGLKANPHGPAVITMHQSADHLAELTAGTESPKSRDISSSDHLEWTYTQLHDAALKFTLALKAKGVKPGMRIATFIPNRVEWQLTLWMTTILRLTLCSVDPGAAAEAPRKAELESFIDRLDPDVIVVPDAAVAANIDAAISSLGRAPPQVKIVLDGPAPNEAWTTLSQLASAIELTSSTEVDELLDAARNDDPNRICIIMFTSGTSSGNPKGCPRKVAAETHKLHNQYWGGFHSRTRAMSGTANFRIIAPTIHFPVWKAGGCVVIPGTGAGSEGVLDAIERHGITFLLFVPALLNAYATEKQSGGRKLDVSGIESVMLGGDMITRDALLKASDEFPQAKIFVGHGMTEGGGLFDWPFGEKKASDVPCIREICPVGTVSRGTRVRIRDAESGKVVEKGGQGELLFSGDCVIQNYLDHTHQDAFLQEDGRQWFCTGDLATMNEDGLVYILGRVKDRIKRAAIPIEPAALESCVAAFTGSTSSVIGWPHPEMGEAPLAVVQDLKGKTSDQVKEEVLSKFGQEYALENVVSFEQLGLTQWPMNATGKIVKTDLRDAVKRFFDSDD